MPATQRHGQSVVQVVRGEKLTELQALHAMLIPSGNNITSLLARWEAGSQAAFAAKMNAAAGLGCAACGPPASAALTPPERARRLAHAPAAQGSVLAGSQVHLCAGGHGYVFTARAMG